MDYINIFFNETFKILLLLVPILVSIYSGLAPEAFRFSL